MTVVLVYGTFSFPVLFLSVAIYLFIYAVHCDQLDHMKYLVFPPKLMSSFRMHDRNLKTGN